MKKLIIEFAFLFAFCTLGNCASVTWSSGVVFTPSDDNGILVADSKYKLADTANASMYLFALENESAYNKVLDDGIWNTFGSKLDSATSSTSSISSSKFASLTSSGHAANSTAYGVVIFTFEDAYGKNWFLENSAAVNISSMGGDASIGNLARYNKGLAAEGQLLKWMAYSVPEPNSALLVVLGLAAVMLKRSKERIRIMR